MNSTTTMVIYLVALFAVMYFLMIRPQQKQQKARQALLESIRVKDKVITAGGIYGKVTKVKENSVMLQIAEKVEIEVTKNGIASVENRKIESVEAKGKKDKTADKPVVEEAKEEENNQPAEQ